MFLEIFYIIDAISNLDPIRVLWDRPNTHLKSSLERLLQTCNHVHCGEYILYAPYGLLVSILKPIWWKEGKSIIDLLFELSILMETLRVHFCRKYAHLTLENMTFQIQLLVVFFFFVYWDNLLQLKNNVSWCYIKLRLKNLVKKTCKDIVMK